MTKKNNNFPALKFSYFTQSFYVTNFPGNNKNRGPPVATKIIIMKLTIVLMIIVCFFLQSCTAQEEKMLKRSTVLFFYPLYYFSHSQGPCFEKRDIIECNWSTQ